MLQHFIQHLLKVEVAGSLMLLTITLLTLPTQASGSDKNQPRLETLSQKIQEQKQQIDQLRDENLVLSEMTKNRLPTVSKKPLKSDTNNSSLILPKDENKLYLKVLEAYQSNQLGQLEAAVNLFILNHPKSVYADNSLYLLGLLCFDQGDFPGALKYFNEVVLKYPFSNKKASALYAKAMVYKKLNVSHLASLALNEVQVLYPGSREAQQASLELKLLNK